MTWDARALVLHCDEHWHDGHTSRSCPIRIRAATQDQALRIAARKGWAWLPSPGGEYRDKCTRHNPDSRHYKPSGGPPA